MVKVICLWPLFQHQMTIFRPARTLQDPMVQRLAGERAVVTGIGSFGTRAHFFNTFLLAERN